MSVGSRRMNQGRHRRTSSARRLICSTQESAAALEQIPVDFTRSLRAAAEHIPTYAQGAARYYVPFSSYHCFDSGPREMVAPSRRFSTLADGFAVCGAPTRRSCQSCCGEMVGDKLAPIPTDKLIWPAYCRDDHRARLWGDHPHPPTPLAALAV